jgi:hypothetical protein
MIIVCSGPDTYRAREKAREFETAFREKHDPEGLATDRIDTKVGLPELLSRLGSASLFAKKKFIRVDGILAKMKIADVRTLASKLQADADNTVICTVETEPPDRKTFDALKIAPCVDRQFPFMTSAEFRDWVEKHAEEIGVDNETAHQIANLTDGDTWFAVTELGKRSVSPNASPTEQKDMITGLYDLVDHTIAGTKYWRREILDSDEDGALNAIVSQKRFQLRIQDGYEEGIHPFVKKKLQYLRMQPGSIALSYALRALISNRVSLSIGTEWDTILQ